MADRTNELKENRPERHDVLLWIPVLAGPVAWALTQQVSFMLAPTACWSRSHFLLFMPPLCTLLLLAAAAAFAHNRWKREPAGSTEKGGLRASRSRFMAQFGFWSCVGFAVVIVANTVPNVILKVCD
jgi:uncharacterized membrane protein YhaH (DUF805 family)